MATFTLRHRAGQSLQFLLRVLRDARGAMWRDRAFKSAWAVAGGVGKIVALEVTHGVNGWHPHLHMYWVFESEPAPEMLSRLWGAAFGVWQRFAVRGGVEAPLEQGQDLHVLVLNDDGLDHAASYPTSDKSFDAASAALELVSGQTKEGRAKDSLTFWGMINEFRHTGDMDVLDLMHEYEQAMRGKSSLHWSRGLREVLEVGGWRSDEEIATEEIGSIDDTICFIEAEGWKRLLAVSGLPGVLLDVARGSPGDLSDFFDLWRMGCFIIWR
jgi:hypothetical protein